MPLPKGPNAGKALQLRLQGLSYSAIARELGLSVQRCAQLLKPPPKIHLLVEDRDQRQCRVCGISVAKSGTNAVHHIDAVGMTIDTYNDPNNLALLCLSCHSKAHWPDRYRNHSPPVPTKIRDFLKSLQTP